MPKLSKYRIYCTTEGGWVYTYATSPPTTCPTNVAHTVNADSTSGEIISVDHTEVINEATYEVKNNSLSINTSTTSTTLSLPKASDVIFKLYVVIKTNAANTITIDPYGSEQIAGASTHVITAISQVELVSNGTAWYVYTPGDSIPYDLTTEPVMAALVSTNDAKGGILVSGANEMRSLPVGNDGQILVVDSTTDTGIKWANALGAGTVERYVISDVKLSGTHGGTFTKNVWQTRDLNTLNSYGSSCSLSSNQVTITAGTYMIDARAPAYKVQNHKAIWYNITDSTTDIVGTTACTDIDCTWSHIHGILTLGSTKTFELRHYCSRITITNGFGNACGFGVNEVYSTVIITKM